MRNLVVALCFLLSGGSGLVFETLWTRKLVQVFDSTTLSIASVLTAFMAGLALGSFVFGRRLADRVRRPIVWYGLIECAVGLWGLLVPVVVGSVYPHVNRFLWDHFEPGYFWFSFLRFLFVLVLLLPPTTLMGATLPLLSRHFVRTDAEMARVGRRVGFLYTLNTLGAVLGTFVAGYVLMPWIGFAWTNRVAALTNIGLGAAIMLAFVAFRSRSAPAAEGVSAEPERDPGEAATGPPAGEIIIGSRARTVALVAFGVSGFAAMNYQVAWNRVLAMVIGGSVYSFTTILLAFLVGIALGASLASAFLRRIRNPVLWLAIVQIWIGLTSAASYYLADDFPWMFAWLVDRFGEQGGSGASETTVLMLGFAVAALAILPSTLGMGAVMPLTVRVCATTRERVGHDVGTIYAVNTSGAIVGSFLSAFVLVPSLSRLSFALFGAGYGLQLLVGFSILLNLGIAVALLAVMPTRRRGEEFPEVRSQVLRYAAIPFVPTVAVILVLVTMARGWTWDPDRLAAGSFRLAYLSSILSGERRSEMLYFYDGMSTTVTVQRWGDHIAMKNNGKVDASNGDDMPTQVNVAGFPLLLHPRGPKGLVVAVIGFGSGVSVGTALRFPVARVDAVELEPAVIESSYWFREENGLEYDRPGPKEPATLVPNPRLHVFSNDGRNYLASTSERYDVIVSEPSNPWVTGVSNLFTVEHFRASRQALAPGGLFCQWVQLYEMSETSVRSIVRTFAEAFEHVVVFSAAPRSSDILLVGSTSPVPLDIRHIRAVLADPDVAEIYSPDRAEIGPADDIPARLILAGREEVLAFAGDAVVNTDDNAYIEFQAPRDMIRFAHTDATVISRLYGHDWRWGRTSLESVRAMGYDLEGSAATGAVHAVSEALVRGHRGRWAADLVLEAATSKSLDFAPDEEQTDDLVRSIRSGKEWQAERPSEPILAALEIAMAGGSPDPQFAADVAQALARYRAAPPQPAAAAWLLERAAADRAELPARVAFLLEAARASAWDDAMLEGVPIATGLPRDWQPLLPSVSDPAIRAAFDAAMIGGVETLAAAGDELAKESPIAAVIDDAGVRLSPGAQAPPPAPAPDEHALRLLIEYVLLRVERVVRSGGPDGVPIAQAAKYWRKVWDAIDEPWASDGFRRVLPELALFDVAVYGRGDTWSGPQKLWTYGAISRTRRRLLERGDPWMERRGVPVPSREAVEEALAATANASRALDAATDLYGLFERAVRHGDAGTAARAWNAATGAARDAGASAALDAAVPPHTAALALGSALVRSGSPIEAWKILDALLGDESLRNGRPELPYWAARALYLRNAWDEWSAGSRAATAGEEELRADLLLASQLMDRWARSGGNAPERSLADGIALLGPLPAGAPPYVPLVSEEWVREWRDRTGPDRSFDGDAIAGALFSADYVELDRLLAEATDRALSGGGEPAGDGDEWESYPITQDGTLGEFARIQGAAASLILFDSLLGVPSADPASRPGPVLDAVTRLGAAPVLPMRLDAVRRSLPFTFFRATLGAARGDRAAIEDLLGPAVDSAPEAGTPLAEFLAACPPARFDLARMIARCGPRGCLLPVESDLRRATALAAGAVRGPGSHAWQRGLEGPYDWADSPIVDMGTFLIRGGS